MSEGNLVSVLVWIEYNLARDSANYTRHSTLSFKLMRYDNWYYLTSLAVSLKTTPS